LFIEIPQHTLTPFFVNLSFPGWSHIQSLNQVLTRPIFLCVANLLGLEPIDVCFFYFWQVFSSIQSEGIDDGKNGFYPTEK